MKIAIVGATGLVGSEMLKVLEERKLNVKSFIPVASERSAGKEIFFNNREHEVVTIEEAIAMKPTIALFSAGKKTSLEYAKKFAGKGTVVIDNSSAWRMYDEIPLVVPEVNGHILSNKNKIIANPNCSTIQLVATIAPLHKKFGIKRLVISTYQSVTGSGMKGIEQLDNERNGIETGKCYPHPIDLNCLPHGGDFLDNGYTAEEMKLVHETHKILDNKNMGITSTVVRVPVKGGHSEAVNIEFKKSFELEAVYALLSNTEGIVIEDEPGKNIYPMPIHVRGKDETFVGRIRRDESIANALNMWIVADNLRKGAATNAVQIAEYLVENSLLT